MGMTASIFKPGYGDASNGGISSRVSKVCIVNVEGPFEPSADAPAVRLIKRERVGNVVCVPADHDESKEWLMFGGTYISCSDARFNRAVEALSGYEFGFPVAFFDRKEA